jgi:hypothetical protein
MLKSNRVREMKDVLESNGFVLNWNKVYNERRKGYQRFKFFLRSEGNIKQVEEELKRKFPNFLSVEFHRNQNCYLLWSKELVIKLKHV